MNMQSMMQQAQKIQKEMTKVKEEIETKTYSSTKSFVEINVRGNKKVESIKINKDNLDKDDIDALEDIIKLAINDAIDKINIELNSKLGKFGIGSLGL